MKQMTLSRPSTSSPDRGVAIPCAVHFQQRKLPRALRCRAERRPALAPGRERRPVSVAQSVLAHLRRRVVEREGDLFRFLDTEDRCGTVEGPRGLRRTGATWKIAHATPRSGVKPPVQRVNAAPGAAARHRSGPLFVWSSHTTTPRRNARG